MRGLLYGLLCFLTLLGPAAAEEGEEEASKRRTVEQAAAAVVAAVEAGDEKTLAALAAASTPDPWLVADALCAAGRHDAAKAFAARGTGRALEGLPAYVAAQVGVSPDLGVRKALEAVAGAGSTRDWTAGDLKVIEAVSGATPKDVASIRLAHTVGLGRRAQRRFGESAKLLAEAAKAAERLGWLTQASSGFVQAAQSFALASEPGAAKGALEARLRLAQALGDRRAEAETLHFLGKLALGGRDPSVARARIKEALAIMRTSKDERGRAHALETLASVERALGHPDEARKHYEESLELGRKVDDRAHLAGVLRALGLFHKSRDEYATALPYLVEAVEVERGLGDPYQIAVALNYQAFVEQALGRYREARRDYKAALEISEPLPRAGDLTGEILLNLGGLYGALGNHEAALRALTKSRAAYHEARYGEGVALALGSLGSLHQALCRYDDALRYFQESLAISELIKDAGAAAKTHLNMGIVHRRLGNLEETARCYERALELTENPRTRVPRYWVLFLLGNLEKQRGNLEMARRHYAESLKLSGEVDAHAQTGQTLCNLGILQSEAGNPAAAISHYEASLKALRPLGNRESIAMSLHGLAFTRLRLGQAKEAREHLDEAASLLVDSPSHETRAYVAHALAELCLVEGDAPTALRHALAGLGHVDQLASGLAEVEGASSRQGFAALVDAGIRAAWETGDVVSVVRVIETGRAATLRESIGSRAAIEAVVLTPELREPLVLARAAERRTLAAYRAARAAREPEAMEAAGAAWDEARAAVVRESRRVERERKHAAAVTLSEPDDLEAIQGSLQDHEALVLYALTEEEALAVVVGKAHAKRVSLGPVKPISALLEGIQDPDTGLGSGASSAARAAGPMAEVRRLLVEPLKLPDHAQVVLVSPTASLGYVPFALLMPKRQVAYAPSGTTLGLLRRETAPAGARVLALGDPDYAKLAARVEKRSRSRADPRLGALPGTKEEAKAIGDEILLGGEATESGLVAAIRKQARWRAVHLACHGLIEPERPMLSALALSADEESDGFLTALEVLEMRVPADLVVMSACETGKGKIYKTEGVLGLTHAFMFAGAPRVLCSLWKVDDAATRVLMERFYELWNPEDPTKGMSAAAALRQAQEYVRTYEPPGDTDPTSSERGGVSRNRGTKSKRRWEHPYYWAAWVLWGLPE